jgi:hypothetical protein
MSGPRSQPPVGRVSRRDELGGLGEKLGQNNGESRFVARLPSHPGWLYKEYSAPQPAAQASRLDMLIDLPDQMPSADRSLTQQRAAWPVSRVVNPAQQTIGVVIPLAPDVYKYQWTIPVTGSSITKILDVDVLALTQQEQRQRGLAGQSLADRISVCASFTAVAALFERRGLVYLDWSYANVFWGPRDHSAYVIDMDGASFGPRPQIQTFGWDDPHIPLGDLAGTECDRFRVALLIARCLTGARTSIAEARNALTGLRTQHSAEVEKLAELLIVALTTPMPADRPRIAALQAALDAANGLASARAGGSTPAAGPTVGSIPSGPGGVTGWVKLPSRGATTPVANQPPRPARQGRRPAPRPPMPVRTSPTPVRPPPRPATRPPRTPAPSGGGSGAAAAVFVGLIVLIVILFMAHIL